MWRGTRARVSVASVFSIFERADNFLGLLFFSERSQTNHWKSAAVAILCTYTLMRRIYFVSSTLKNVSHSHIEVSQYRVSTASRVVD